MAQCILEVTLIVNGDEDVARLAVVQHLTAWYLEGRGNIGSLIEHRLNSTVELARGSEVVDNQSFRQVLAEMHRDLD